MEWNWLKSCSICLCNSIICFSCVTKFPGRYYLPYGHEKEKKIGAMPCRNGLFLYKMRLHVFKKWRSSNIIISLSHLFNKLFLNMGWWTILISKPISSGRDWVDREQMEHKVVFSICSQTTLFLLFLSVFFADWDPNVAWNEVLYIIPRDHNSWLQLDPSVSLFS